MTAIKAHLFALLLTLSAMTASQAALPGAALDARQPQPTQAIQPRQDCSGIFDNDDGSVIANGLDCIFGDDDDNDIPRASSIRSVLSEVASSVSAAAESATGPTEGRASSIRSVLSEVASSVSAAEESATGSPDGAAEGGAATACLAAALVASLMGACIFF